MGWLVLGVWIGAVVLAALLLGFFGYELFWKARRLRTDLGRLTGLTDELAGLQSQLAIVQERVAAGQRLVSVSETG